MVAMLLDFDRFKQVNDTYGHETGDRLLVEVSRRLESSTRPGDVVARLGGDEFAILMSGTTTSIAAATLAERVLGNLVQPLALDEETIISMGTFGYTTFPEDMSDVEGLLRHADQALTSRRSKGEGLGVPTIRRRPRQCFPLAFAKCSMIDTSPMVNSPLPWATTDPRQIIEHRVCLGEIGRLLANVPIVVVYVGVYLRKESLDCGLGGDQRLCRRKLRR